MQCTNSNPDARMTWTVLSQITRTWLYKQFADKNLNKKKWAWLTKNLGCSFTYRYAQL